MSLSSAQSKEPGMGPKNEKAPLDGRACKWAQKNRLNGRVLERRFAAFTAIHAAIKAGLFRAEKVFPQRMRNCTQLDHTFAFDLTI
ncbi:hypothetical protein D3C84_493880 [compost metagenome]